METFASAFVARHIGSNVDPTGVERLTAAYLAEWRRCVRPDPEADAVVGELAPRYRLSIITNTHHPPLVREVLEETGIQEAFAQVVMSAEVGFRKPHPAIFRHALDRLHVPAVQAVFVGDTYEDDLLGAAAIGMHAVLIDPHNRYADRGLQRVARLGEVPGWLRTLAGA